MRRRIRRIVVAEVDVHGLGARADARGERVVGGLAPTEIPEGRGMFEVVDADGAGFREAFLDAVPRRMLEVEGES